MRRFPLLVSLCLVVSAAACGPSVNVQQERDALLAADREWSASAGDIEKFMTFVAADASVYPPGAPVASGSAAVRAMFAGMSAAPGFAVQWAPAKAEVGAGGVIGHTVGTYEMTMNGVTEKGKYVTLWRKADGAWKVTDDIFNADEGLPSASQAILTSSEITWGDVPPFFPAGAKMAVVSGDPSKNGHFVVRLQMPAGYRIAAHWHPTDEHVTVLSGTFGIGMGDTFDQAALKEMPAGGYAALPAHMNHFAAAKTASTVQVNGLGPFVINYVNPADDPRQSK
jgi:ketosteroid isomerase-like protein/quercetin dioxygenase-like cupin family protein